MVSDKNTSPTRRLTKTHADDGMELLKKHEIIFALVVTQKLETSLMKILS